MFRNKPKDKAFSVDAEGIAPPCCPRVFQLLKREKEIGDEICEPRRLNTSRLGNDHASGRP